MARVFRYITGANRPDPLSDDCILLRTSSCSQWNPLETECQSSTSEGKGKLVLIIEKDDDLRIGLTHRTGGTLDRQIEA